VTHVTFSKIITVTYVSAYSVNHSRANACATHYEFIVVNGQTTTSAFHKLVQRQYKAEVIKTTFAYVKFFSQCCVLKIIKIANVSESFKK